MTSKVADPIPFATKELELKVGIIGVERMSALIELLGSKKAADVGPEYAKFDVRVSTTNPSC